jgi:hypothetical protein
MSTENKRVVASPESEAACLDHYTKYGWTMASRQEIHDTHTVIAGAQSFSYSITESVSGTTTLVRSHVNTVHYVSFLLQRDDAMPQYQNFVTLEGNYDFAARSLQKVEDGLAKRIQERSRRAHSIVKLSIWSGVLLILSILLFLTPHNSFFPYFILPVVTTLPVMALLLVFDIVMIVRQASSSSDPTPEETSVMKASRDTMIATEQEAKKKMDAWNAAYKPLVKEENKSVEERLRALLVLKEKNLLSEEEYNEKREAIIKDL